MEKPMISVIMGVFNQWDEEELQASVNSILKQSYGNFEFIIWDDGSHPDAARLLQELPAQDKRIVLAGKDENHGLAYSLNECIRLAQGKYIARMDADDMAHPDRFAKQVEFLESHPEYGWCGTNTLLFDENGVWGSRNMPQEPTMRDYYHYSPYVHPSVMFRARLFDENLGYLDSEETLRCEDYEIFMNLVQRGQKGYNLQEQLFYYRETRDSYKKRKARFRINEAKIRYRNYRKMGKLFPVGWLYVCRPLLAIVVPSGVVSLVRRSIGSHSRRAELHMQQKQIHNSQQIHNPEVGHLEVQAISKTDTTIPA